MKRKPLLLLASAVLVVSCSTASRTESPSSSAAPATGAQQGDGSVVRLDPAFDALVPKDAQIEKLAGGFTFIEGPLWRPSNAFSGSATWWATSCASGRRTAR